MPPFISMRQPPNDDWVVFDLAVVQTVAVRQPPDFQWVNITIGYPTGFLPGPPGAYYLFDGTGVGTGSWQQNPLFQLTAETIECHVLPSTVAQGEAIANGATLDHDIALAASTENGFSVVIHVYDGTNRATLRYLVDARRVGGAATSGVVLSPVSTDVNWAVAATASGNDVRVSVTNNTGAAGRISFYADPFVGPNVAAP
jgi:hypothetical protein